MTATRIEHDGLGPVSVPADRLWRAQAQRSLEHFSIGDDLIPREMIPAYAIVKKAAALVNHQAGRLGRGPQKVAARRDRGSVAASSHGPGSGSAFAVRFTAGALLGVLTGH
jgi:fumarate hydratase class II